MPNIYQLLSQLFTQVDALLKEKAIKQPLITGIRTGGVWIAEALHQHLDSAHAPGSLDISFYRDDFSRQGLNPTVLPSTLPFQVDGRHLLLIDDVLMTGRTIRAALNEIFDYGRPASVNLIALCSINSRELPIQPDLCTLLINLKQGQYIQLSGPQPLSLQVINKVFS